MDNIKIQIIRLVLLTVFVFVGTDASSQELFPNEVINRLYHVNDSIAKKDKNYIIITNKSCKPCFTRVCDYYSNNAIKDEVYGIVVMDRDYRYVLSMIAQYKREIPCLKDIYFLFTDTITEPEFQKIVTSPSPQAIMYNNGYLKYFSYTETMRIINVQSIGSTSFLLPSNSLD